MQSIPIKRLGGLVLAAAVTLALVGCKGDAGPAGTNGTNGTNGTDGTNGTNATITVNAAALTPDQWSQLSLKGQVTSVTMGGKPVVNFTVTNDLGVPVSGLGYSTKASTALAPSLYNMAFTIAKLVPGTNGSPSRWMNYIVTTMPTTSTASVPTRPTTDNTGTLVDHGDGTYSYAFYRDITQAQAFLDAYTYTGNNSRGDLGDVSYQDKLTHRVVVQIGGRSPIDSTTPIKKPANIIYDFIPSTGQAVVATDAQRQITTIDTCNTCHSKLTFHGGNRVDTQYCVMCHNDQRKYGYAEASVTGTAYNPNESLGGTSTGQRKINGYAVGDFPVMIHKIHMGEELGMSGYNYATVLFNEVTYPQDQRNCTKCHTAATSTTPQGDAWMKNPSRLACGACHDTIDWNIGTNHQGGGVADDSKCAGCHGADGIQLAHVPLVAPDTDGWKPGSHTNGSYIAAYGSNLPPGAHRVTWDLKTFTVTAAGNPQFVFQFKEDGVGKPFTPYAAGLTSFWDGYIGGPSFYAVYALAQDGITNPADWTSSASTWFPNVWNQTATGNKAADLTGPDATGYYTLTMTGVTIPAGARMVTGGIGYTYGSGGTAGSGLPLTYGASQLPLTQTNVPNYLNIKFDFDPTTLLGGLAVPAPNVSKLASGWTYNDAAATQNAGRRAIVTNQKCNDCHAVLGVFTKKVYHAGERNDAPTCTFCHNVNRVNSGWGVNIKDAVHAIHASGMRDNKYSWEASAGAQYWTVTNPAILNDCEACHVPGSYDFSASANAGALPNLLWTVEATGQTKKVGDPVSTTDPTPIVYVGTVENFTGTAFDSTHLAISPFISAGVNYGSAGATTNLVTSPITAACSSCHDSKTAIAHFQANGGAFYEQRGTVVPSGTNPKVEQCLICHGAGKTADIKAMHMNF